MMKSANKMWRESGTTLNFKDWLIREKEKYANFNGNNVEGQIPNVPLRNKINEVLDDIKRDTGYKTETKNKTVLGLNQNVVIIAGVIIAGAIAYRIYKNIKK
jgi:hypothetical protein